MESVISNVAVGAGDPTLGDRSVRSELGRVQISFVEFEKDTVFQHNLIWTVFEK